jgi:Predicted metal-binding protein (DUF2103)
MTRGKHRVSGTQGKLKFDHHMIEGLQSALEAMSAWPEVNAITAGRIRHIVGGRVVQMRLRVTTTTVTGLKLSARSRSGVQEVFVVTSSPDQVAHRIRALWPEGKS